MTTTLTTARRERIEALIAVAVHPKTDPVEASTALAGAQKVAANAGATDLYAFRFSSIGLAIALNIVAQSWTEVSPIVMAAAQRLNGSDQ